MKQRIMPLIRVLNKIPCKDKIAVTDYLTGEVYFHGSIEEIINNLSYDTRYSEVYGLQVTTAGIFNIQIVKE